MSSISEISKSVENAGLVNDAHRMIGFGMVALHIFALITIELIFALNHGLRWRQIFPLMIFIMICRGLIRMIGGNSWASTKEQLRRKIALIFVVTGFWTISHIPDLGQELGLVFMGFTAFNASIMSSLGRFLPRLIRKCLIFNFGIAVILCLSIPSLASATMLGFCGIYNVVLWIRLYYSQKNYKQVLAMGVQSELSKQQLEARQHAIKEEARTDELTQIGNRRAFYDHCRDLEKGERENPLFLALMDLDGLKQINDIHGHEVGDHVIIVAASRLEQALHGKGQVYRLGGDEFAIIYDHGKDSSLESFKTGLLRAFHEPLKIRSQSFSINWSIGIVKLPDQAGNIEKYTAWADYALYKAKAKRGPSFHIFSQGDQAALELDGKLAQQVIRILNQGAIKMFGQPILGIRNGAYRVIGIEALLRAGPKNGKHIDPKSFVRHAALSGFISRMTELSLEAAIDMHRQMGLDCPLYFNLSREQIRDKKLESIVLETTARKRFQMDKLVIELSEKTLQADIRASTVTLNRFKRLGAKIALDDFGSANTGFSSLIDFEADMIKTDRSLLAQAMETGRSRLLLRKVIELCEGLNIPCIIEGIETQAELSMVTSLGGDVFQGFYFGMPGEELNLRPNLIWQDSSVLETTISKLRANKRA